MMLKSLSELKSSIPLNNRKFDDDHDNEAGYGP